MSAVICFQIRAFWMKQQWLLHRLNLDKAQRAKSKNNE